MRPLRDPTDAELDAIPVSDAEVEAYIAKQCQLSRALDRAGIPATLDWVYVVLAFAVQAIVIVGMSRGYFQRAFRAAYKSALGDKLPVDPVSKVPTEHALGDMKQRIMRVAVALRRARIHVDGETALQLAAHAARQLYIAGFDAAYVDELAGKVYDEAIERVHASAQRRGGSA